MTMKNMLEEYYNKKKVLSMPTNYNSLLEDFPLGIK